MDLSRFFESYIGLFIAQSFSHTFITAIIVHRAIKSWRIKSPDLKQKFHYLAIIFPLAAFPAYQLINPARRSLSFRLGALFDMNRWLTLEILGKIPGYAIFILLLLVTSCIFFFQEALPIIRHLLVPQKNAYNEDEGSGAQVRQVLESLPGEKPNFFVLDDEDLLLYSTTGRNASIYLSRGLVQSLDTEQLRAALAHEIAHIDRNRKPFLLVVFLFRVILFFNPVVLLEFRRVVQEEEKICDDMAVMKTGKPSVLAETLKRLYLPDHGEGKISMKELGRGEKTFEERSHIMLIQSRITRLESKEKEDPGNSWLKIAGTIALVAGINYFIV